MDIYAQLHRDEGFIPYAYPDPLGYLTIGIGTCIDKRVPGTGLTLEEAKLLLQRRLGDFMREIEEAKPWVKNLDDARYGVLQNMVYNLGVKGLLGFKDTLALIEQRKYAEAARAMLASKWAGQVGERATRLARQMETGIWQ
jgi:lysozyme